MKIISRLFESKKKGSDTSISDRRCSKRYDVLLGLKYCDPATNFNGEGVTKNISRTGLKFTVGKKTFKGAVLDLVVEDPNGFAPISSKAKVIWLKEVTTGDDTEEAMYEVGVKLLKKRLY